MHRKRSKKRQTQKKRVMKINLSHASKHLPLSAHSAARPKKDEIRPYLNINQSEEKGGLETRRAALRLKHAL